MYGRHIAERGDQQSRELPPEANYERLNVGGRGDVTPKHPLAIQVGPYSRTH